MEHVDVKPSTYIDPGTEYSDKDIKFNLGEYGKISKYKMFLRKITFLIGQKTFLQLKTIDNLYVKWKGYDNSFDSCYFLEQYTPIKDKIEVEIDLSNYATKKD